MLKRKMYYPIIISVLTLVMLFGGCKKIETTTEIYADGSCKRTVVVQGDSSAIFEGAFPIPSDSSWSITTIDTGKFTYIAGKKFNNVADLDRELNYSKDKSKELMIIPELTKKFRWFYTIFSYKETYKTYNKIEHIPFRESFTPEELKIFYSNDDSTEQAKQVEIKLEDWDLNNTFIEFFDQFVKSAQELKDPNLNETTIRLKKDQIFQLYKEKIYEHNELNSDILDEFEKILRLDIKPNLSDALRDIILVFKEREESMGELGLNEYSNHVILPGLIIDTNANTVEGNKVSWEIDPKKFIFTDFEMTAESRVVNRWAIVVSVAFVIFAVVILLLPLVMKKKA